MDNGSISTIDLVTKIIKFLPKSIWLLLENNLIVV